ncbi:MAG: alpha/beta hydrolase [Candidatus Micrarchaeota archaeon]
MIILGKNGRPRWNDHPKMEARISRKNRFIERAGAKVFYRYRGPTLWEFKDRPKDSGTLVLQGGYTTHPAAWMGQIKEFKKRHGVITKENRGHWGTELGESTPKTYLDDMALDLKAVMDREQIPRAIICGHSMWGGNAMRFYHMFPERVSGLVLVAPAYRNPLELGFLREYQKLHPLIDFLARNAERLEPLDAFKRESLGESRIAWELLHKALLMTYMKKAQNPTHALKMVKNALRANLSAMAVSMQAMFLMDDMLWERAPEISVPTYLIAGSDDPLVSADAVKRLAERIPGALYEEFPDCAHFPMLSYPERFNESVDILMRSVA